MGVALTGGASGACGGIATSPPPGADAGGDEPDVAYPLLDAGGDHYDTIGYIGSDGDPDGYATIRPADAYPTIGVDTGADGYPTIGTIGSDAGADGYPIIH
jgi:hypothetical protein